MGKLETLITTPGQLKIILDDITARQGKLERPIPSRESREEIFDTAFHEFWQRPKLQQTRIRILSHINAMRETSHPTVKNFASVVGRILDDPFACEVLPFAVGEDAADYVHVTRYYVNHNFARCELAIGADGSYAVLYTPGRNSPVKKQVRQLFQEAEKSTGQTGQIIPREKQLGFAISPEYHLIPIIQVYDPSTNKASFRQIQLPQELKKPLISEINTVLSQGVISAPGFDGGPYHQIGLSSNPAVKIDYLIPSFII